MILPGKIAFQRGLVANLRDLSVQIQPCGIDLTIRHIRKWTSPGMIDFDNTLRSNSKTEILPFSQTSKTIHLPQGAYLLEFNETVGIPLDIMGQIFVRSSMFRSGALVTAGVIDSGYKGAVGGMLQVLNAEGLILEEGAKMAQMVFHEMSEETEGYSGVYQGDGSIGGESGGQKQEGREVLSSDL